MSTLPVGLALLTNAHYLHLAANELSGSLPAEMFNGSLSSLRHFSVVRTLLSSRERLNQ